MGLLSLFGASPETQKGLLDFFPEFRRQRMEEDQQKAEMEWRKRQQAMQEQQFTQGQQDRQRGMNDDALVQRLYGMPVEGAMPQGQQGPGMPMPNIGVDPQTFLRQGGSVARLPSILGLNSAVTPKRAAPVVSKPGDIARGEDGSIVWQNPEAAPAPGELPALVRLQAARDALPPNDPRRKEINDAIRKMNYLAPVGGGGSAVAGPAVAGPPKLTATQEKTEAEKLKTGRQSEQMLSAIQEARSLLGKNPTQSGIGSAVDYLGRKVGVSSGSAQTAAQLETLSGWMVANVPRMEGPQSNFDIQNYQTMAAKVGDRSVPVAERLAALGTLEGLHRKYAEINGTPLPTPARLTVDTNLGVPGDIADIMKKYSK